MRVVPDRMTEVWLSGQYTGKNRPFARATIQRTHLLSGAVTQTKSKQRYASYLFGYPARTEFYPVELPNIKSVSWQRSIDMDAGSCTLMLYNTREMPMGQAPKEEDWISGQPGYFTFNRGDEGNPWNHTGNFWTHRLYPDMLIRTYEGYGWDLSVTPDRDPNQMPSGVWLIDTVTLGTDGMIQVKCRDAARLLMDQIVFPPVVPTVVYPDGLVFDRYITRANPKKPVVTSTGAMKWINPKYANDSGAPWYGRNYSLGGHRPSDAFDSSNSSYWLSVGNASPRADYAYEWVEGTIPTSTVAAVRIYSYGGPYRCYVSLHTTDKGWVGNAKIPYNRHDPVAAPNGADIPYVKSASVAANDDVTIDVKDTPNVDRVRFTFHDLWDSNIGTYQYRAAVRDVDVLVTTEATKTTWVSNGVHFDGNYADYSDIVKMLLAYGGWLWPSDPNLSYQLDTDESILPMAPSHQDEVLLWLNAWYYDPDGKLYAHTGTALDTYLKANKPKMGSLWADIELSGTYGEAPLTSDIFDKKPLMDGIAYVRDMLGFIFFMDEDGAAQFKTPNIWGVGNWKRWPNYRQNVGWDRLTPVANQIEYVDDEFVTIHQSQTLNTLAATLDSRNVRERVVVANVGGDMGAVTVGFSPYDLPTAGPAGLRRVSIWSDMHFTKKEECQIMADLIAVRQLFTYRTDTVRVPGYPKIQIDDQIKLTEQYSEEVDDLHYVKGLSSTLDMSTGDWWYDIETHWLGTQPFGNWAFSPDNLASDTKDYLKALGINV